MSTLGSKAQATAVAVVLLLGACDSNIPSGTETSAETMSTATSTSPPTTHEGEYFDYRRVLVDWGWLFARPDIQTVRGHLVSAEGSTMVVDVTEELTQRGATLGEVEFFTGVLGLTSAEDMTGVIEDNSRRVHRDHRGKKEIGYRPTRKHTDD